MNKWKLHCRLWLTKRNPDTPVQQLGHQNIIPEKKEVELYANYGGMVVRQRHMFLMGDPFLRQMYGQSIYTTEGLKETVEKLNVRLQSNPLPGMKVISKI